MCGFIMLDKMARKFKNMELMREQCEIVDKYFFVDTGSGLKF